MVYGNSYKNGIIKGNAFRSTQPAGTPYLLKTLKDHRDMDMAGARISAQLGTYLDGASIVWMDQPNLIRSSSLSVVNDIPTNLGSMDFLEFEVKKGDICNGNAVIAVKLGNTIVWSWHLWFDHADALDKIPCKNYGGITYKFTRNTLGQVYSKYEATSYDKPRKARLTIEQQAGNGGVRASAPLVIMQNPENKKEMAATFYQFGRKDALPGTDAITEGNYSFDGTPGGHSIGYAIQHPEKMFAPAGTGTYSDDWCNATYLNLWSMDNTVTGFNDAAVVKTIYDPCPAGFHMPASNAFTGFATTGNNTFTQSEFNVSGAWDYGWHFNNKISSPDATVYFPALGYREWSFGMLYGMGAGGCYWSAVPNNTARGCYLSFGNYFVAPMVNDGRAAVYSVRPVADN
ncbi:hypothetical protein SAMN02745202_01686 [Segatella oulorum]|uniref:Fimbrillin-like n=1 Tax=Segatella oulorum TaxID=28136 RepID=A0A1T4Q447_9BACT|nr:hypothetical protein SAMN02745202_01686 [Segatella oulorum]